MFGSGAIVTAGMCILMIWVFGGRRGAGLTGLLPGIAMPLMFGFTALVLALPAW